MILRLLIVLALLLSARLAFAQAEDSSPALIIDEIACRGNVATSCDFILGHLYLSPGDPVDEEEIGNARLRLASQPAFQSIAVYLEKGASRGRVKIVVEVVEADPYAREWLLGTSWRRESARQLLNGRFTNQNLFGTGKLLDLSVIAIIPLDGLRSREYGARLQYVDPHWLGSKRTFFIAGISGGVSDYETLRDERIKIKNVGADLLLGRRIWDFSYLSLYYRYNPHRAIDYWVTGPNGDVARYDFQGQNHAIIASYGWNSEDDPYFPTRGSRAFLSRVWASNNNSYLDRGFRKTWTPWSDLSVTIKLADSPGTEYRQTIDEHFESTVGIARPFHGNARGEVTRGRWYVEAGYGPAGRNAADEMLHEYGLKAGIRLQTRSFGLVDLYVIGAGLTTSRHAP